MQEERGLKGAWTVERLPELNGYTVEWAADGDHILSRRNSIFHSKDLKPPFNKIAEVSAPIWRRAAAAFRLPQRLLRFMVTNVVRLENGDIFVAFDRSVGLIRDGEYRTLRGLVRPCRILRSGCAVSGDGSLFFGEYLANDERGQMRIYKLSPGNDELQVVHTFPPGSIKHVHGVYFDPFSKALLCLTGDDDAECRMLRTFDEFRTLEVIGEGDESWRAVSALFSERHIYYGTDAEFRENQLYRMDRSSGERETLGEVTGTVFYSKKVGADMFFATTAENAPSQTENVAAIWHLSPDNGLTEITKFQKDRWHRILFMFGTVHFPYVNAFDDRLYFSLVAAKEDNETYVIRRTA
jgi:hypothetical protein